MSTWRDTVRPIIWQVLQETRGQDEAAIRRALRDAYPFGQRKYWPYKVWLDEVKTQRGLKPQRSTLKQRDLEAAGQGSLFDVTNDPPTETKD